MSTEYKQMLSVRHIVFWMVLNIMTRQRVVQKSSGGNTQDEKDGEILFKASHVNHPTNKWVRMCRENYGLMFTYHILCCNEYEHRYGKIHGAKLLGYIA